MFGGATQWTLPVDTEWTEYPPIVHFASGHWVDILVGAHRVDILPMDTKWPLDIISTQRLFSQWPLGGYLDFDSGHPGTTGHNFHPWKFVSLVSGHWVDILVGGHPVDFASGHPVPTGHWVATQFFFHVTVYTTKINSRPQE
jgi:hypothetical protein